METTKEKEATFTPGPWEIIPERNGVNIQEKETNHLIAHMTMASVPDERLIALAPEMHELLVRVSKGNGYDSLSLAMDARELLAKVEGVEG